MHGKKSILVVEYNAGTGRGAARLPNGRYRLNTEAAPGTIVCECLGPQRRYEGTVEVFEDSSIKAYEYALYGEVRRQEGYLEYPLPNECFRDAWTRIVYDEETKYSILELLLKIHRLEDSILRLFSINKAILVHGPPGVGKTTLCRAVAQRFCIRTGEPYLLREISCAQIFSKFYGESVRTVAGIFGTSDSRVIFLVDEVESLLMHRGLLFGKNEPNDTLRIVNTLLGILDQRKSIFIFTSNFIEELDHAFIDRCDLVLEMGALAPGGIYELVREVLYRLMDAGALECHALMEHGDAQAVQEHGDPASQRLLGIAGRMAGMSGRKIKKIIFSALGGAPETIAQLLEKINESI